MEDKKTHWREFHPTDYIGAYAFEPGEEKILTIKTAKHEKVKDTSGKTDDCLVVHFKEDEKPLIVNVTNSKAISKVAGSPYIEDWPGTVVALFTMEVSAFGETVEAVRVRQTAPRLEKPELHPLHDKWDKAVQSVADGKTTIQKIKKNYRLSDESEEAMKEAVASLLETGEVA